MKTEIVSPIFKENKKNVKKCFPLNLSKASLRLNIIKKNFSGPFLANLPTNITFFSVFSLQKTLYTIAFLMVLCSPFIYSVVSIESVSRQWRPWSDCTGVQADLGLRCLHMPKNTFFFCTACSKRATKSENIPLDMCPVKIQIRLHIHSLTRISNGHHYENMPIQIYWKFHFQKLKIFR